MNYEKIEKAALARRRALNVVVYTLLTVWALVVLFPFYWMVLTSLKSYGAYNSEWIPQLYTLAPTFQNYRDAFTAGTEAYKYVWEIIHGVYGDLYDGEYKG